jgi:hypothetical protein
MSVKATTPILWGKPPTSMLKINWNAVVDKAV